MSLIEQREQAIQERQDQMMKSPGFNELRDFYKEMQRLGIAQKQEYTLPAVDTIGRRLYQMTPARSSQR